MPVQNFPQSGKLRLYTGNAVKLVVWSRLFGEGCLSHSLAIRYLQISCCTLCSSDKRLFAGTISGRLRYIPIYSEIEWFFVENAKAFVVSRDDATSIMAAPVSLLSDSHFFFRNEPGEMLKGAVIGLLGFRRKKTARYFPSRKVGMKAITADSPLAAGIGTRTLRFIFLAFAFHDRLLAFMAWSVETHDPVYTVNGLTILPRTIDCRSNDPFMSLHKKELETSECGRQT